MAECGIAYVETRLELELAEGIVSPFVKYVARTPETAAVVEVFVRSAAFEGDAPKEIILTVTPA